MWILWLIISIICYIIYTWRVYAPKTIWETLIILILCINPVTFFIAVFLKGVGDDSADKCDCYTL